MKKKNTIIRASVSGLFCLAVMSQSAFAEKAEYVLYDAKKLQAKGTVLSQTETMGMNECAMVMEMQGQKLNGSMTRTGEKVKVVTYDTDTQVTVEVKKSFSVGSVTMMGQQQPPKQDNEPLHEKTIILTKVDGKWVGKMKEGEATEKQKKEIDKIVKKFNGEGDAAHIYGTAPRKVGDSWDVDPSKITSFGNDDQKLEGTFKITFQAIEKSQGLDCALLVADVDLTGATSDGDMKMNIKGKFRILRSLEHLVDLENNMQGTMKMTGTINQGAGKMEVNGPMVTAEKTVIKLP